MINQEYKSTEEAINDLTNCIRPFGRRFSILEPSTLSMAKTVFNNLKKSARILATKEEIEQIATQYGWSSEEAGRLAKKFGS